MAEKQYNAATLARGNQFKGYGAVNDASKEAVVSSGGVSNSKYPRTGGNYNDDVGSSIKMVTREGKFVKTTTLPDYGRGINISSVTHVQVEPSKYSSSEQANP